MARKRILWSDWSGGISQTPLKAPANTFLENRNIDVTSRPGSFRLSGPASDYLTLGSQPTMLVAGRGGHIYTGLTDGKVYRNTTLKYTATSAPKAFGELSIGGTIYTYVFRTDKIDRGDVLMDSVTADWKTIAAVPTNYRTIYNDSWIRLIWGAGNVVYQMDTTETVSTKLTLPSNESVVAIKKFNDLFRIYTRTSEETNGRLYLWDGVSSSPNYLAILDGCPPYAAETFANTDFVVAGSNSYFTDLYQFSGLQYSGLFSQLDGQYARGFALLPYTSIDRGIFYGVAETSDGYGCIYRRGGEFFGYENPLAVEYCVTNASGKSIFGLARIGSTTYFCEGTASTWKVRTIQPSSMTNTFATSGNITSNLFTAGAPHEKKKITGIKIQATGTGDVTLKADRGTNRLLAADYSWSTIVTKSVATSTGDRVEIYVPITALAGFQDAYGWSYRVELAGSGSATPEVSMIETQYEDEIND